MSTLSSDLPQSDNQPLTPAMDTVVVSPPRRTAFAGLQWKLILPYAVLTLVLAAIGVFVIVRLVSGSVRERFVNQLSNSATVASEGITRREKVHLETLRLMAFTEGMAEALVARDQTALQDRLLPLAVNNNVEIVSAVDLNGLELITLGKDAQSGQYLTSQGADFSAFEPVHNVLTGFSDQQGDKFVGILETAAGPALVTVAPVKAADGSLAGALMVGTRLSTLLADVGKQAVVDNVVIFDENYHLVASHVTVLAEDVPVLEAAAQDLLTTNTAAKETRTLHLGTADYELMCVPLKIRQAVHGWIGVILSSQYVVAAGSTSRNWFIGLFSLGTLAIIVIGYVLAQSIARPILRLRSMSQAVAAGNLEQNIGLRRADEIGDLAEAFDQMTLHLRERTAEAARLYAETVQRNQELAKINAQLQAAQIQLIQSEKLAAIGQLTAGIIHDVKNPLTVIRGLAEVLQGDPDVKPEMLQELKVIRESAVKASNIVADLLKFARQSKPENMEARDLRETVEAALRLTAYLSREARVEVIKDLPEEKVLVEYDPQQIEQVLVNLIHNAIQAMPDRGKLWVNLSRADGAVAIGVQDTGSGIAPENLRRIFDPFFTTKPEGVGTGLGLSVSYGIIASHGGRIDVESVVGQGTTFTILLPAKHGAAAPTA